MRRRLSRWFLPRSPDLLGLLLDHARIVAEGLTAFAAWGHGDEAAGHGVRQAEKRADKARSELVRQVREAFWSPLEPEDLFELAERLDAVIGEAKDLVREAEVMAMEPDEHLTAMTDAASAAGQALSRAIATLGSGGERPYEAADDATHQQRVIERCYRRAMAQVTDQGDLRTVIDRRELYRRGARLGDAIGHAAHRVEYALVKRA